MKLRQLAVSKGVKIRELRQQDDLPDGCDDSTGPWFEYRIPLKHRPQVSAISFLRDTGDEWLNVQSLTDRQLQDLQALPASVRKISIGSMSVMFVWNESSTPDELEKIIQSLGMISTSE